MKHLFSLAAVLVLVGAIFVAIPTSVFGWPPPGAPPPPNIDPGPGPVADPPGRGGDDGGSGDDSTDGGDPTSTDGTERYQCM